MKKSYVYLLTTFMLWGSLYVVSQFVLGKIPTFTVAMFRYLIAFIALSLISLKSEKEKIEKSDYKYFFIMGFIGYFISVDCQLLGTKIAGGSMASLINSLNPVIISVMAMIILNEKLEMNKIVGIILSPCQQSVNRKSLISCLNPCDLIHMAVQAIRIYGPCEDQLYLRVPGLGYDGAQLLA